MKDKLLKKKSDRHRRKTSDTRLGWGIMLLMMIPVLLSNIMIISKYSNELEKEIEQRNREIEQKNELAYAQIENELKNMFINLEGIANDLSSDQEVQNFLLGKLGNFQGQEAAKSAEWIKRRINRANMLSHEALDGISMYSLVADYVISDHDGGYINDKDFYWYDEFEEHGFEYTYADDEHIILLRNMSMLQDNDYGLMILRADKKIIEEMLDIDKYGTDIALTIRQRDGSVLFSIGDTESVDTKTSNVGEFIEMELAIDKGEINNSEIIKSVATYAVIYMLAGILIAYILTKICMKYLYGGVVKILAKMGMLGEGAVARVSNNAIADMREGKNIESALADALMHLHNAQITALQMQINPHFISNSLNYANAVILRDDRSNKEAAKMLVNLSDILGYAMEEPRYSASVAEEIEVAEKYIEIERMKILKDFDVVWNIENKVLPKECLKLFLQPILENAVMHGIKKLKDRKGVIEVSAKCDGDDLVFVIKDNGYGIKEAKLEQIREQLNEPYVTYSKHVGMRNVNERIKLIYGDEYGVSIDSDENGTTVTIKIGGQRHLIPDAEKY